MKVINAIRTSSKFKPATPHALPPTVLTLGEKFGASITLDGARRISHIEASGMSYVATKDKERGINKVTPHYWVDIWLIKPDGDTHILRSQNTDMTRRAARDLHRDVTRRIATFLFENKDVPAQPLQATADDGIAATRTR